MRPFAKLRAFLTGYFWLPCPICGRWFGGYEIGGTLWMNVNAETGTANGVPTCRRCPGDHWAPGVPQHRKALSS